MLRELRIDRPLPPDRTDYPFCLKIIKNVTALAFPAQVTFFVGENGTGKSTILEAIAHKVGFGAEGGSKNIAFTTADKKVYAGVQELADYITLSWRLKPRDGYFFRAESFHTIANFIDMLGEQAYKNYGGKSLHAQSHGESFLSFFTNRVGAGGFFILDEPEAALSPQRQLTLLSIIHLLSKHKDTQFIIATHSPILLAYPQATIYSCDTDQITSIAYTDTPHYRVTRDFLNNPERYLHYLFQED